MVIYGIRVQYSGLIWSQSMVATTVLYSATIVDHCMANDLGSLENNFLADVPVGCPITSLCTSLDPSLRDPPHLRIVRVAGIT